MRPGSGGCESSVEPSFCPQPGMKVITAAALEAVGLWQWAQSGLKGGLKETTSRLPCITFQLFSFLVIGLMTALGCLSIRQFPWEVEIAFRWRANPCPPVKDY